MKPQNYSLKFQNSLADSRIIPGSQHLVARENAVIPKGQRAVRRPTKAEQKKAMRKGRVEKNVSARKCEELAVTPLEQLLSKKAMKMAKAKEYAELRKEEKRIESEKAGNVKGILKATTSDTDVKPEKSEASNDEP